MLIRTSSLASPTAPLHLVFRASGGKCVCRQQITPLSSNVIFQSMSPQISHVQSVVAVAESEASYDAEITADDINECIYLANSGKNKPLFGHLFS